MDFTCTTNPGRLVSQPHNRHFFKLLAFKQQKKNNLSYFQRQQDILPYLFCDFSFSALAPSSG
jgi:hypothetical protein